MKFEVTIRTADRAASKIPRPNYVRQTVTSLNEQNIVPHVFPTNQEHGWLLKELDGLSYTLHEADRVYKPNENGLRAIAGVPAGYDWLIVFEDDVTICADFFGSVQRWLEAHERPEVHMYRLWDAFVRADKIGAKEVPCAAPRQNGSQAVLVKAADVPLLLEWGATHIDSWRPEKKHAQHVAWDKFLGQWAVDTWPEVVFGLVAVPFLVNHIGKYSGMRSRETSVMNASSFCQAPWNLRMTWVYNRPKGLKAFL